MLPDRLYRLLTAYVDGELRTRQRKTVLRLLRRSSEARVLLRQLQGDADGLRSLPRQTVGHDLSGQVLERIAPRSLRPARHAALTRMPALPVWLSMATAAAVLLVVSVGSYFYFAAAMRKETPPTVTHEFEKLPFAPREVVRSTFIGPLQQKETANPPSPPSTEIVREPLPLPKAELPGGLSDESARDTITAPVQDMEVFKEAPDVKLALNLTFRGLEQKADRQRLQEMLRKPGAYRIEVGCRRSAMAMAQLQGAFKDQGIRFVIDQDAQDRLSLPWETHYALYVENVTPEEVFAILQHLNQADRSAEKSRHGPGQFRGLVVNSMSKDDHRELSKLLGIDPTQLEVSKPKTPLGVDIRKPVSAGTEEQVVQALKGQGSPRPEPGQPGLKAPERLAMVVSYNPIRPRRASREVKLFLDSRKERRPGTLQVLLVLRGTKS